MDIFETKSEVIRSKLAGMKIGDTDSIAVAREDLSKTRCLVWAVKGEFSIDLKSRYKDGLLHIKRIR